MTRRIKTWAVLVLRIGFGLLLTAASIDKILHPLAFAQAVENYGVIGENLSYWVAVWLPWLEALTGLLLIFGLWRNAAIWINALLMTLFLALVLQAYARGLDISCGCFRLEDASSIGPGKLIQNLLFNLLAIVLLILYQAARNEPSGRTI
jgi:uncharacterized membrane protein YphA (DoxX/SURF4 family)